MQLQLKAIFIYSTKTWREHKTITTPPDRQFQKLESEFQTDILEKGTVNINNGDRPFIHGHRYRYMARRAFNLF